MRSIRLSSAVSNSEYVFVKSVRLSCLLVRYSATHGFKETAVPYKDLYLGFADEKTEQSGALSRQENRGRKREDSLTMHCGPLSVSAYLCVLVAWHPTGAALECRKLVCCSD